MIKIYYRSVQENKLDVINEFRKGVWIHVVDPSEEEIVKILEMTKVESDLVRDALDEFEVPRLESERGAAYIFTRVPVVVNKETQTQPLLVVVGEDFVLTVSRKKIEAIENYIKSNKDIITTKKTKLFLVIMAVINREYSRCLVDINKSVRALRFQMGNIKVGIIVKFVDLEKVLNDFLSALLPTNTALENIKHRRQLPYHDSDLELIEDLSVDFEQQIALTKSILKHVVNIRDAYSSVMTHDLNRVMKILTVLTIILTVPTIVFSFYGMNVNLPFDSSSSSALYIASSTIILSLLIWGLFIRNRWL